MAQRNEAIIVTLLLALPRAFFAFVQSLVLTFANLFRVSDRDNTFFDEEDYHYDGRPTMRICYEDRDEPYEGEIFHDVKVDTRGCVYFKIGGRWRLQGHVCEMEFFNITTANEMTPDLFDRCADDLQAVAADQ